MFCIYFLSIFCSQTFTIMTLCIVYMSDQLKLEYFVVYFWVS